MNKLCLRMGSDDPVIVQLGLWFGHGHQLTYGKVEMSCTDIVQIEPVRD